MSVYGGLMGGLFGELFSRVNGVPVTTEGQEQTQEFAEMAVEMIDEFIESPNAVWVANKDGEPIEGESWNVKRGDFLLHNVKILFLQDSLEDRQLIKYLKGTEANDGQINGIMYRYTFEPRLSDTVRWNGRELTVRAIDPVAPIDHPIIYMLELGA